jgi:DNA-binding NarL/FixJ family response regulator
VSESKGMTEDVQGDRTPPEALTTDELVVLSRSATGLDSASVARLVSRTPGEVRGLLASATCKLGARSRLEAVVIALRIGLIHL